MQTVISLFLWLGMQALGLDGAGRVAADQVAIDRLASAHPFHVSVTELHQNSSARTLEVQCKFFTDDFEATLNKVFNQKADLADPGYHQRMDSMVNRYVQSRLQLRLNGKAVELHYLGFEQEREATYVYLEVEEVKDPIQSLEAQCRFLYEKFTDQVNIFHVSTDKGKKSSKLDYPTTALRLDL